MKPRFVVLLLIAFGLSLTACQSPNRATAPGTDHLGEVLAHPQAPHVARDYPAFFDVVARKIARLQHDLRIEESR